MIMVVILGRGTPAAPPYACVRGRGWIVNPLPPGRATTGSMR